VSSSFTLNGECQTSRSLGKLKPSMDAGFVRHAGQGALSHQLESARRGVWKAR
jgi:hypothetical protein